MRLMTIFQGNHNIEIHNSHFGLEMIYYDDELVSKISSIRGGFHKFEVEEDGEWVTYVIMLKASLQGVSIDVFKNEKPILLGAA